MEDLIHFKVIKVSFLIILSFLSISSVNSLTAESLPISYDVENRGEDCSDPITLKEKNLQKCSTLPDPFRWSDGSGRVTSLSDWTCRRNEIKREIEQYEIGEIPKFDKLEASFSDDTLIVKITNKGNTLTLKNKVLLPRGKGPHPIVIGIGSSTGSFPISYFSECIKITFEFTQIADYGTGYSYYERSPDDPFYKLFPGTFSTKSDFCGWTWGISRIIDGLEIVKDEISADLSRISVTGCSYLGKAALFAGAFDERIALTIVQESGGGGINSWRISEKIGSSVEGISNTNYDWFLHRLFEKFNGTSDLLPHDHHELIAMIAPRAFISISNPDITFSGDESGYISIKAAEEVWKAMGVEDRFGYVFEGGENACSASPHASEAVKMFIDKFLYGEETEDTADIKFSTIESDYNSMIKEWAGFTFDK